MWHRAGFVLASKLSKLGSVRRCVVVIHEVVCDVAKKIGTDYDAGGYVGRARWTESDPERWATENDFVFGSGIVVGRGCRDHGCVVGSYWMCGHVFFLKSRYLSKEWSR